MKRNTHLIISEGEEYYITIPKVRPLRCKIQSLENNNCKARLHSPAGDEYVVYRSNPTEWWSMYPYGRIHLEPVTPTFGMACTLDLAGQRIPGTVVGVEQGNTSLWIRKDAILVARTGKDNMIRSFFEPARIGTEEIAIRHTDTRYRIERNIVIDLGRREFVPRPPQNAHA